MARLGKVGALVAGNGDGSKEEAGVSRMAKGRFAGAKVGAARVKSNLEG